MSIAVSNEELTVVIVDDDVDHRQLMRAVLERDTDSTRTLHIFEYGEPDVALASLPPDGNVVMLVDYHLNGATGLDWIQDFTRTLMGPVIIVTSSGDEEIAAKAFRLGAADYLDKGNIIREPLELWASINRSIRRFKLERTNRSLARSLKLANAELTAKNDKLAILTRNAQQFVEDVAHEFRTPLTVIKEFASIIADGIGGDVSPKQISYLDFINDATSDLANLVDDFLDSSKLRTGMLRVHRKVHKPQDIIDSTWKMVETRAATKSIAVEKVIPSQLPLVFVDAEKAGRALLNLVTNAIKFTNPDGRIRIQAVPVAGAVRFEVEDEGPGLTQEEIDHLFERFHQCERSHHLSEKGFGLGLSIVRDLVHINLGKVEIWSTPGEGSVFAFTVPAEDHESIISAFLNRAREQDHATPITALAVVNKHPVANLHSDIDFLSSTCYGTDLLIPFPQQHSIIMIGQTAKSKGWIERIQRVHASRFADSHGRDSEPLQIEAIGMWRTEEDASSICKVLERTATGVFHGIDDTDH
ncbi:MAG: hybrid sensor histidine kinase/response regulator [Phycisphaerales bacterium]|nr:hybrid sensor histidine kinase/response regulator [Phycisphaerales bacterium]MCB9835720.1 hybrid sensor histidine kinase/response regulator [Phycisphaera sp.]